MDISARYRLLLSGFRRCRPNRQRTRPQGLTEGDGRERPTGTFYKRAATGGAIVLAILFSCASARADGKYVLVGTDPVVVLEDDLSPTHLLFRWDGATAPKEANPPCYRLTAAVGFLNTIEAERLDFTWDVPDPHLSARVISASLAAKDHGSFADISAPYTGYLILFSPSSDPPQSVKYEVRHSRSGNVTPSLNGGITTSGINYLPSLFSSLLGLVLYPLFSVVIWIAFRKKSVKYGAIALCVLLFVAGAVMSWTGKPGRGFSAVCTERFAVTLNNERPLLTAKVPVPLARVFSTNGTSGLVKLSGSENGEQLAFDDVTLAGEYHGKVRAGFISADALPLTLNVADWFPYLLATVALGWVFGNRLVAVFYLKPKVSWAAQISGALVVAIVAKYALYSVTWGSVQDYAAAFAASATVKPVMELVYRRFIS